MKDGVFFRPFVGASYAGGGLFGKRIMVLGESHYCDEGCADCGNCLRHRECMEFTSGVVEQYLDRDVERQRWMQTLLKFERSLVGCETDQAQSQRIWQSVVFYNYLQVAMGGPREAGTAAQYRQAGEALFDVMEKYQPECLIVWGNRLWDKLPGERWTDGGGHRRGRLSHSHGRLLLGKWQDGEGDGGKPSLGGLLVGLLAPGDSKLLEIVGYRVWTSE